MNTELILQLITTVIQVLGFILVIYTIWLTLRELKSIREQTHYQAQSVETDVLTSMFSSWFELDKFFVERPELFPYFYQGKELGSDDPLYMNFTPVASLVLDVLELTSVQLEILPRDWHAKQVYEMNCRRMFAMSPMLCRYFDTVSDAFSGRVKQWREEVEVIRKSGGQVESVNSQAKQHLIEANEAVHFDESGLRVAQKLH